MKRLRIAVAEDEWLLADELCKLIETMGQTVVGPARTGADLVALAEREHPDLALVDIRLARGSSGLRAAQEIQERFAVPAVAVTGHLSAEEAKNAGLLGLVRKPWMRTELRATLAAATEWLETGRVDPTAPKVSLYVDEH